MKKWEYCMRFLKKGNEYISELNSLGNQGWEIVGLYQEDAIRITFLFKREME